MTVLWCGGEDTSFISPVTVNAGYCRSTYNARCGVKGTLSGLTPSTPFTGGSISSGWLSAQVYGCAYDSLVTYVGFMNAAQNRGLCVGNSSTATKAALKKVDGTTVTELAAESGNSLPSGGFDMARVELQLVTLGASGEAKIYVNGNLVVTYNGDLSWLDNPDCVGIKGATLGAVSEIMVADEDLRAFPGLATIALNAAGDSNAWTGVYSDINEVTIDDAGALHTNATAQDALFNLANLPSGTFTVAAVQIDARAAKSASGTATQIALGIKSGGSVNVGSNQSLGMSYGTISRLMVTNPVTSAAFTISEINALQFAARSA